MPAEQRLLAGGELAVFVEVNLSAEAQKAGCAPAELPELLDALEAEPGLALRGLMAIPEGEGDAEASRRAFVSC